MKKKGQVNFASLLPAVVLFAVAVLALSLMGGVIEDTRTATQKTGVQNVTNESVVNTNIGENNTLSGFSHEFKLRLINESFNVSNVSEALGRTAWVLDLANGVINISSGDAGDVFNVTYNYTHYVDNAQRNVTSRGLTGATNLSSQFGNLGTVIAIVTIIALLTGAFLLFRR